MGPKSSGKFGESASLKVNIEESKVEKFLFDSHPKVKQMSDHYGLSTIINIAWVC